MPSEPTPTESKQLQHNAVRKHSIRQAVGSRRLVRQAGEHRRIFRKAAEHKHLMRKRIARKRIDPKALDELSEDQWRDAMNHYLGARFFLVCSLVLFVELILWPYTSKILFLHAFIQIQIALKSNPSAWINATFVILLACSLVVGPVLIGAFIFVQSIERRIQQERQIQKVRQKKLYARRNLMITDMAHDLRTPVMSIGGLAQALADGLVKKPGDQERYLRTIQAKAERMGRLTDVLFEFTKLESEGYKLYRKRCDLPQIVLEEAAASYTDAEEAGLVLQVEIPENPLAIYADERQLGRVFANLISNAIKYNPAGTTIYVGLTRLAGVAAIVVGDTGIPIAGDAEELFEPFSRGDMARTSSATGSGLGLYIAKRIVDLHGYQIRLEQPYQSLTKAFIVTCTLDD